MFAALVYGASGYLQKNVSCEELRKGVRAAAAGGFYFTSTVARRVVEKLRRLSNGTQSANIEGLSQRENEMVALVTQGYTNAEIASNLHLSVSSVKNIITRLKYKLNVNSRVELATLAVQSGFLR